MLQQTVRHQAEGMGCVPHHTLWDLEALLEDRYEGEEDIVICIDEQCVCDDEHWCVEEQDLCYEEQDELCLKQRRKCKKACDDEP